MGFPERRTTSVLLTILLFTVVCSIAYAARHVILLFVLSAFFAYLMNPVVKFVQRHSLVFKGPRGAAVVKVYIGILILTAVAAYIFGPAVAKRSMQAVDQVPVILDGVSTGDIATQIGDKYAWDDQQKERLKTILLRHKQNFQGLQNWIDSSLSQGARIVGWLALVPIVAMFFLRDGYQIVETAIRVMFGPKHRPRVRMMAEEIHAMLTDYIRAQVFLCALSLGFYTAVLVLFRFPYALALAVLGGILEFIPVVGWMSTAALIVTIGLANDLHWVWMAVLLLLWRVAQDYFNLPRALGHRLEMHPLTVIFAVLGGAEVGGIVGIYLAVPIAASLSLIWRLRTAPVESPLVESPASEVPPSLVEIGRD